MKINGKKIFLSNVIIQAFWKALATILQEIIMDSTQ
jgi:hypothetical protein